MAPPAPTSDLPPNVQSLVVQAKDLYAQSFGGDERTDLPTYCSAAPGRVNLIGEHTDYTGGYVLPLAIGYNTVCYGRGGVVKLDSPAAKSRIVSSNHPVVEFTASLSSVPSTTEKWVNYVQGVALQYLPDLRVDETFAMDVAIAGDVPLGSGLSSSASLEVATAVFLECILEQQGVMYSSCKASGGASTMCAKEVKMERAVRCQRAENNFCNVPCGIMDQFVSSAGCHGKLLLIDCRSLDFREVSVGNENTKEADMPVLVVANSNVKHDLGDGEYPVRVKQCKEATEILAKVNPEIKSLRDATMDDIAAAASSAGLKGVLLQRARHVVSENKRTVETADALEKGDWALVGTLMNASHSSMKDDYEVSCEEIDVLVDLAQSFDGVYGSRLTGGGFGGCTVTLVKKDSAEGLMAHLNAEYETKTGTKCDCFVTSPGDGARAIGV
ncbi:hypothetical protein ACHAXT_003237 [Thalassiosira profunda]